MNRYRIGQTPDQSRWVIIDWALGAYCTLPDAGDPSTLLPLEWDTKGPAEAWLQQCYRLWSAGVVPAPEGWHPPPKPSAPRP